MKIRIFYIILLLVGLVAADTNGSPVKRRKPENVLAHLNKLWLPSSDGKAVQLSSVAKHRATVFIFLSSECPISNRFMPTLTRLSTEFTPSDIQFYGIISDPDCDTACATKFLKDYNFPSQMLLDPQHQLVKLLDASITPEAFVLTNDGTCVYQGRIDDRYIELGKDRPAPTTNDLRNIITEIFSGKKMEFREVRAIGCAIPPL